MRTRALTPEGQERRRFLCVLVSWPLGAVLMWGSGQGGETGPEPWPEATAAWTSPKFVCPGLARLLKSPMSPCNQREKIFSENLCSLAENLQIRLHKFSERKINQFNLVPLFLALHLFNYLHVRVIASNMTITTHQIGRAHV